MEYICKKLDINIHMTWIFYNSINKMEVMCCYEETNKPVGWFQRFTRLDYILIYGAILAVNGIFLLSYLTGVYLSWYAKLKQDTTNVWIPRVLWVAATLLSYVGLYILWKDAHSNNIQRYLSISVLYLIAGFLTIGWSAALYQLQDITLALWASVILFVYEFWIFIVIWYIRPLAAVFIIPLVAMYLYLVYTMIHLAYLNDSPA